MRLVMCRSKEENVFNSKYSFFDTIFLVFPSDVYKNKSEGTYKLHDSLYNMRSKKNK